MVMTYNFELLGAMLSVALAIAAEAQPNTTEPADMQAIEKLHQKHCRYPFRRSPSSRRPIHG